MRRSWLFIPGHRPAQMQTADLLQADAIVFDLEDAVDPEEKTSARELVCRYLSTLTHPNFETIVRINAVDSPYFEADIEAMLKVRPDALMIPKATVSVIKSVADRLSGKNALSLIALIETAKGLIEVEAIAATGWVSAMAFGAEDFRLDMGIDRRSDAGELAYPRAKIAVAAKAYGIDAIDTPWIDTWDDGGLTEDASRAKALGFSGKLCIHPSQVASINRVFSPTTEEIRKAKRIVDEWRAKQTEGIGVFRFEGKMIDKPVALQAEHVLRQAKQTGWRDPSE